MDNVDSGAHSKEMMRVAVVLGPGMDAGAAANAAAIVVGGLRCEAFTAPIVDTDGHQHAGVRWNVIVLRADKEQRLVALMTQAREAGVQAVAFTRVGKELGNSFDEYCAAIISRSSLELPPVSVGLFGPHDIVRRLTKAFSVYKG